MVSSEYVQVHVEDVGPVRARGIQLEALPPCCADQATDDRGRTRMRRARAILWQCCSPILRVTMACGRWARRPATTVVDSQSLHEDQSPAALTPGLPTCPAWRLPGADP